jgi:hypothetical protein
MLFLLLIIYFSMFQKIITLLSFVTIATAIQAQQPDSKTQVINYIQQYKDLAIQEQIRTGVPASIKLAQGILETAAGASELCNNAQNHFGIKCKNTWQGDTYTYTDDAKDECFRKYNSSKASYLDHSDFLKNNKRYSKLFALSPQDYKGWSHGLKSCGYATNPKYAVKLIKYIEEYNLQEHTLAALQMNTAGNYTNLNHANDYQATVTQVRPIAATQSGTAVGSTAVVRQTSMVMVDTPQRKTSGAVIDEEDDDGIYYVDRNKTIAEEPVIPADTRVTDYYQTTTKNGLKGFYAKKGDMLLEYAIKNKIRYAKLLEINDLPDAPLEANMFVYLSKKPKTAGRETHVVTATESLLQISQAEGIQLEQLRILNQLDKEEEPVVGAVLNLQTPIEKKPQTYYPSNKNAVNDYRSAGNARSSYVPGGKKSNAVENTNSNARESGIPIYNSSNNKPNIANEPTVERTVPQVQQVVNKDENMSALDKLKAHMDKAVYSNTDNIVFKPKSSRDYSNATESNTEEYITTPASTKRVATASRSNTAKRTAVTTKKGKNQVAVKGKKTSKSVRATTNPSSKAKASKKAPITKNATPKAVKAKGKKK